MLLGIHIYCDINTLENWGKYYMEFFRNSGNVSRELLNFSARLNIGIDQ